MSCCINEAQLGTLASFFEKNNLKLDDIEWESEAWGRLCERLNVLGPPKMNQQCWMKYLSC